MILNKTSISVRIIALVLIPMLGFMALSLERYVEAKKEKENLATLSTLLNFASISSLLISDIQDERIYSMVFTTKININAPLEIEKSIYRKKFAEQIPQTDLRIEAYNSFVLQNKKVLHKVEGLAEKIEYIQKITHYYPNVREKINDDNLKMPDSPFTPFAINHYSESINALISTLVFIVLKSADNEELSLSSNAYLNLVSAKDYTNRTVSMAPRIMMEDSALSHRVFRMNRFYHNAKNDLARFKYFSTQTLRQSFEERYDTNESVKLVDKTMKDFASGNSRPLSIDTWFKIGFEELAIIQDADNLVRTQLIERVEALYQKAKKSAFNTLLALVVSVIVIGVLSFFIVLSILNPIGYLVKTFNGIAKTQDISKTLEIGGNDEVANAGKAFNHLIKRIDTTLHGINQETNDMSFAVTKVADAMEKNLNQIKNQNIATDNISVAIEELSASMKEVAESTIHALDAARRAHDYSTTSSRGASSGREIIDHLVNELNNTNKVVEKLNSKSEQIGSVLDVIQTINAQMNMLALNASIEAARAGDFGRGFSVVADEVRALAQSTTQSTETIREQIQALQDETLAASQDITRLQSSGAEAASVVEKIADDIEALAQDLTKMNDISVSIASMSEEQLIVAVDIAKQVARVKDDSDAMASQAQTTSECSQELTDTEEKLRDYVRMFKISEAKQNEKLTKIP